MNGKERMKHILRHEKTDRIAVYEHFWDGVYDKWRREGHIDNEPLDNHFGFDMGECWPFNYVADLDFVPQITAEDEHTVTVLDGNGARLRRYKNSVTTPEHVGFSVTDKEAWERDIKPKLTPDRRRIDFASYRNAKKHASDNGRFFVWAGINSFECIHPVCGHENMLMGMALDPDWIKDMADTYARLNIQLQEILFEEEGYPDGIWYYEDMGFKEKPFMSPAMYEEMIQPAHAYTIDYAKSRKLPVIMHSCGFVEPLLPGMISAGIDCLQAMEVKAGMDLLKLNRLYGEKIAFMGGLDIRALCTNDKATVDKELESKIPVVKEGFNFILHTDHSIPQTVEYDTYRYFIKRGLELGTYN